MFWERAVHNKGDEILPGLERSRERGGELRNVGLSLSPPFVVVAALWWSWLRLASWGSALHQMPAYVHTRTCVIVANATHSTKQC